MINWNVEGNRIKAIEKIANKLGFKTYEDWYKITTDVFRQLGLMGLLKHYGHSASKFVKENFHKYDWKIWLFPRVSKGFWEKESNVRAFFEWLKIELAIVNYDDWYKIQKKCLIKYSCSLSLPKSLKLIYPEYDWKLWLFGSYTTNIWDNPEQHRDYFIWVSVQLGIEKNEDWYNITSKQLNEEYRAGILLKKYYSNSVCEFVSAHISHYDWKPWLFNKVSNSYWNEHSNRRKFGEWLEKVLDINTAEKWYTVAFVDFKQHGGSGLLQLYYSSSPGNFVLDMFPAYNLEITKFKNFRKSQSKLYSIVKRLFPENEIIWEHKHDKIRSKHNRKLELDVFVPERNLAFEMQGEQHYLKHNRWFEDYDIIQERDNIKRSRCKDLSITLVEIPFTWDRSVIYIVNRLKENGIHCDF